MKTFLKLGDYSGGRMKLSKPERSCRAGSKGGRKHRSSDQRQTLLHKRSAELRRQAAHIRSLRGLSRPWYMVMGGITRPSEAPKGRYVVQKTDTSLAATPKHTQVDIGKKVSQADRLSKDGIPDGSSPGNAKAKGSAMLGQSGQHQNKEVLNRRFQSRGTAGWQDRRRCDEEEGHGSLPKTLYAEVNIDGGHHIPSQAWDTPFLGRCMVQGQSSHTHIAKGRR